MLYIRDDALGQAQDAGEISSLLASGVAPFWLDCTGPGAAVAEWLRQRFAFHPLALEDLTQINARPRLSEYEEHLFLVVHAVANAQGQVEAQEVHCFLTPAGLVTAHEAPCPVTDGLERALTEDPGLLKHGPDYVLYMALNFVAEAHFSVIDAFDETIDLLEVEAMEHEERSVRERIFALRRGLATMRRLVTSLRDALNALLSHQNGFIRPANVLYFRDVHSQMVTVHEILDNQRELTNNVLEVYLSSVSNRLNNIVRRLTIVSTIFLPASFVAGVFGTNFTFMPFNDPFWFGVFLISLALAPLLMIAWYRYQGLL